MTRAPSPEPRISLRSSSVSEMNGATERVHLSQISFHSDRKDEETKRKVQFGSHDSKHRNDFGVSKSRQHMVDPDKSLLIIMQSDLLKT